MAMRFCMTFSRRTLSDRFTLGADDGARGRARSHRREFPAGAAPAGALLTAVPVRENEW